MTLREALRRQTPTLICPWRGCGFWEVIDVEQGLMFGPAPVDGLNCPKCGRTLESLFLPDEAAR